MLWYFLSFFGKEKLTLRLRLLPMKERQHKEFLFRLRLGIQRLFRKENTGKQTIADLLFSESHRVQRKINNQIKTKQKHEFGENKRAVLPWFHFCQFMLHS